MYETKFEDGSEITSYYAVGYAEGFEVFSNPKDELRVWSYLIGTKSVYDLQGWFGRIANLLIEKGYILEDGTVNWDLIHKLKIINNEDII